MIVGLQQFQSLAAIIIRLSVPAMSLKKLQRESQTYSPKHTEQDSISSFTKLLSTNPDKCFGFISLMLKGTHIARKNYSDFFFSQISNIFQNEKNTKILKGAAKFLTVLLLIGNLHIYQNFIQYLLPLFAEIIAHHSKTIKTLWPLELFCRETLFLLATWLPHDFYDDQQASIFVKIARQLAINCEELQYFSIDKLIGCYRIIKNLGFDKLDQKCVCDQCFHREKKKVDKICHPLSKTQNAQKMREKLYILHSNQQPGQNSWSTGFQIEYTQQMEGLQNMLRSNLSEFNQDLKQSYLYYPLHQKIFLLQNHLSSLKRQDSWQSEEKKQQQQLKLQNAIKLQFSKQSLKETKSRTTEKKYRQKQSQPHQTSTKSPLAMVTHSDIGIPLQSEFKSDSCDFFSGVGLSSSQLTAFKQSLLRFNQKVYLKKTQKYKLYCICATKNYTLKIRIYSEGEENKDNQHYISIVKNRNEIEEQFNQEKGQFTIKLLTFIQPLELCITSSQQSFTFTIPLGLLKVMTILPFKSETANSFNFKFTKSIKLMNPLIRNYQILVQNIFKLESLDKNSSRSIAKTILMQKMKGKYERRCQLFGCQFLLVIKNNRTQYIDVEICCEQICKHINLCSQLLKQLIFINSS